MANKVKSLLGGPGFYAVLALCVLAVGVGGYFLLFGEPAQTEAPTGPDTAASAPVEDLPEHEPVVETVPPEEPEEETEPVVMPEVTIPVDDTPVVAEEPHVVVLPIQGEVLTAFSVDQLLYNETLDDWRTHDGVDIAAAEGDAVLAACAGTVSSITDDPLMGTTVVIQHSGGYETTYANLQVEPAVETGDTVSAGQTIGAVGTTAAAEAAPSFSAAMERIPLPQPRSSTRSPCRVWASTPSRHSWVEAWDPVPKVRPGLRYSGLRPWGIGSSRSHWGTTYSRWPIARGL